MVVVVVEIVVAVILEAEVIVIVLEIVEGVVVKVVAPNFQTNSPSSCFF